MMIDGRLATHTPAPTHILQNSEATNSLCDCQNVT